MDGRRRHVKNSGRQEISKQPQKSRRFHCIFFSQTRSPFRHELRDERNIEHPLYDCNNYYLHVLSSVSNSQCMAKRSATPQSNLAIDAPQRRRLPLLLRRAWYGLNRACRRRIAHLGVTPDQFTVMRTLLEREGITQRELAHAMSSDAYTVASL